MFLWVPFGFPLEIMIPLWVSFGFPLEIRISLWVSFGVQDFPLGFFGDLGFPFGVPFRMLGFPLDFLWDLGLACTPLRPGGPACTPTIDPPSGGPAPAERKIFTIDPPSGGWGWPPPR